MIWIASKYAVKNLSFEKLKYGDDLYGKEEFAYEIWQYIEEHKEIGSIAFREKYKEYKFY